MMIGGRELLRDKTPAGFQMECSAACTDTEYSPFSFNSCYIVYYMFNSTKVFEAEFKLTNLTGVKMNRCNLQVAM